jgi:hypothetical protein
MPIRMRAGLASLAGATMGLAACGQGQRPSVDTAGAPAIAPQPRQTAPPGRAAHQPGRVGRRMPDVVRISGVGRRDFQRVRISRSGFLRWSCARPPFRLVIGSVLNPYIASGAKQGIRYAAKGVYHSVAVRCGGRWTLTAAGGSRAF